MNKTEPVTSLNTRRQSYAFDTWKIFSFLILATVFITGVMTYSMRTSVQNTETYASLVDAAMEAKVQVALAHLWFEEIISGDSNEIIAVVWANLDQAEWYIQAILNGGESNDGKYRPAEDPVLRSKIKGALNNLRSF